MPPTADWMSVQTMVPPSAGSSRISKKMPALTMVAECRNALTGASAAMALGSQKWKGNWALLVSAPMANKAKMAPYQGWL